MGSAENFSIHAVHKSEVSVSDQAFSTAWCPQSHPRYADGIVHSYLTATQVLGHVYASCLYVDPVD